MTRRSHCRPAIRAVAAVGIALILAGCGPVHTAVRPAASDLGKLTRLAVVVVEEGEFTVIRERASATATPAVMFGLIGAAVAAARNKSLDDEAAKSVEAGAKACATRESFVAGFRRAMERGGRPGTVEILERAPEAAAAGHDGLLRVRLLEWGLRAPAPTESDRLAAFLEVETVLTATEGKRVLWEERDTAIGKERRSLDAFQGNPTLVTTDLTEVARAAGYRAALQLLYPKEVKP